MSANSKIEWTDHTFNPWIGCTKVSPACDHCYAERSTPSRTLGVTWGAGQKRLRTSPGTWNLPLRWNVHADTFMAMHSRRQRVFCASLADVFDNEVDPGWRIDLFELIRRTPNLDWLLLTKRVGNVMKIGLPIGADGLTLPNIWLGATICNQEETDRDLPKLLATPARVRFLSIEPLLGPVSFEGLFANPNSIADGTNALEELDWVIVGGESGPNARPMHPDWARSLRDQCQTAGVPFFFKQWGEWTPGENVERRHGTVDVAWWVDGRWTPSRENLASDDGHRDDEPDLYRVGKKAAGRLLDGRTWDEVPL